MWIERGAIVGRMLKNILRWHPSVWHKQMCSKMSTSLHHDTHTSTSDERRQVSSDNAGVRHTRVTRRADDNRKISTKYVHWLHGIVVVQKQSDNSNCCSSRSKSLEKIIAIAKILSRGNDSLARYLSLNSLYRCNVHIPKAALVGHYCY